SAAQALFANFDNNAETSKQIINKIGTYYSADRNYSEEAETDGAVIAIDDLNEAIHKANAALGTTALDTAAKRKAFFDYAAAYVGNKTAADNAVDGKDFSSDGLVATADKSSVLYGKVVEALAVDQQKKYVGEKGLHQIKTDEQLAAVVTMSADDLTKATMIVAGNAKDQAAIVAHLKAANEENDADKKIALQNKAAA
ncbi:Hypothetical predicted protein, partial [Paramuricea clavata]